jgi:Uma2 family endonuclease
MAMPAPSDAGAEPRYTVERYLALFDEGVLDRDDRVELLEGVVVAMPPSNPPHAAVVSMVMRALFEAIGRRAAIRVQSSFHAGRYSMPEPDVAVVAGRESDYDKAHPTAALLLVEVAEWSLPQDRLTKRRIYAAAGVPEYWIVNLRDEQVEVLRAPDPDARSYGEITIARRGDRIALAAIAEASVAVDDLLPRR